jgi:hypothetical protein
MRALLAVAAIAAAAALSAPAAAESGERTLPAGNSLKQLAIGAQGQPPTGMAAPSAPSRKGGEVGMESLELRNEGLNLPAPQENAGAMRRLDELPTPRSATQWQHDYEFRPGKWAQTDYDFANPGKAAPAVPDRNRLKFLQLVRPPLRPSAGPGRQK